jgi:hypothetical protein
MTEEEWWSCAKLKKMMPGLRGLVSERKNRLFNVACCRRIWHLYRKLEIQSAILVGERYADGLADQAELKAALQTIHRERSRTPTFSAEGAAIQAAGFTAATFNPAYPLQAVSDAIHAATYRVDVTDRPALREQEERFYCSLVREFFRPPFSPISVQTSWLSANVKRLAETIYQDHSFEEMPVLADALEEAGCTEPIILEHLRQPGPHARGCWCLDSLLEREAG